MLTPVATLKQLQTLQEQISSQYTDEARIIGELIDKEVKRRERAGRKPTSNLSRKEQNREAQQRFRDKKKDLNSKPK